MSCKDRFHNEKEFKRLGEPSHSPNLLFIAVSVIPCLRVEASIRSKCLTYSEVDAPSARLRSPVDEQTLNRLQLIAEIKPDETEWRIEPQPRSGVITQIAKAHRPRFLPHVAGLDEQRAAKALEDGDAHFGDRGQQALPADGLPRSGERAQLVYTPP